MGHSAVTDPGKVRSHLQKVRALIQNTVDMLDKHLLEKAESIIVNCVDFQRRTALHLAVESGQVETVEILLNYQANPDIIDTFGISALNLAIDVKNYRMVRSKATKLDKSANNKQLDKAAAEERLAHKQLELFREKDTDQLRRNRTTFALKYASWGVVLYLAFLALLGLCGLMATRGDVCSQSGYFIRTGVEGALRNQGTFQTNDGSDWLSIGTKEALLGFLQGPLVDTVFPDKPEPMNRYILESNRIVGALRLRQLRVEAEECRVPRRFSDLANERENHKCYSRFESGHESRDPHAGTEWSSASQLGGTTIIGLSDLIYPASGHVIDLPVGNRTFAIEQLAALRENGWIDSATRAVFIEVATWNEQVSLVVWGVLSAEFFPSGDIRTSSLFIPFILDRYNDDVMNGCRVPGSVYRIADILLAALVLADMAKLAQTLLLHKPGKSSRKGALKRSALSIVGASLMLAIFILRQVANSKLRRVDDENFAGAEFINLHPIANLRTLEGCFWTVAIIVYLLGILRFAFILPIMGPTVQAVVRTTADKRVIFFTVTFGIIIASFAFGLFVGFGNHFDNYRTFGNALITVLKTAFGDFNIDYDNFTVEALIAFEYAFGPFMFVVVLLVMALVMLNVFIALINDVYTDNLRESEKIWQRQVMELQRTWTNLNGWTGVKNTMKKCCGSVPEFQQSHEGPKEDKIEALRSNLEWSDATVLAYRAWELRQGSDDLRTRELLQRQQEALTAMFQNELEDVKYMLRFLKNSTSSSPQGSGLEDLLTYLESSRNNKSRIRTDTRGSVLEDAVESDDDLSLAVVKADLS
eukprot:c8818_g1_i1.p1 GENE.c8818_g1_i1~~c8818_g1_i1.p1  ORF type:complete len:815 (-),score=195.02 c8818_g1_i1:145-2589(-)